MRDEDGGAPARARVDLDGGRAVTRLPAGGSSGR